MLGDFTTLCRLLLEGRPPYLPIGLLSPWQEVRERDPPGCCSLASSVLLLFVPRLSPPIKKGAEVGEIFDVSNLIIDRYRDPKEYMRPEFTVYTYI